MDNLDYEHDLKIEIDALDLEWLHQPRKYMKYAELTAKAEDTVRRKKNNLAIIDSQIDKETRDKYEKPTVAFLQATIDCDKRHQDALDEYNTALYNADILSGVLKAMEHKKTALENEVRLWAGSYFAGPKEPRDLKKILDIKAQGVETEKDKVREQGAIRRQRREQTN